MSVLENVKQSVRQYKMFRTGEIVLVAVSGGPDSLCLLHALHSLSIEFDIELHVAHLEHGIRGEESIADAAFVVDLAREWDLACTMEKHDVPTYAAERGIGTEEAAREVRYAFLSKVAQAVGANKVAMGHHADDQAETILLNLLRGTGPRGLRGMQPVGKWPFPPSKGNGKDLQLIRPLLHVSRAEIEDYCQRHDLKPRFDRTNIDTSYLRNRIRHRLIPVLETYNPAIRDVLQRIGMIAIDDYDYLQQQVLEAWRETATETDKAIVFSLVAWQKLHPSLQRGLLRKAIYRLLGTLQDVEAKHIELGLTLVRDKPTGSMVHLPGNLQLHKSYETFTLGETIPTPDVPQLTVEYLPLAVPGMTRLPNSVWYVEAEILTRLEIGWDEIHKGDPWVGYLDRARVVEDLMLRCRQAGDRFQPLGLDGRSKSVRRFMIDAKIPGDVRDALPLVVFAEHIVWIPGWRMGDWAKITESTQRIVRLVFRRREVADARAGAHLENG